jgi:hypothetical protein
MNTKRLLTYLFLPLTMAVNSAPSMAVDFTGTIVNYDQNADVVSNPARLTCIQVLTSPTSSQWGCVYANNRLAARIENTYLQATLFKRRVSMRGNSFDANGFLIIRSAALLP